MAVLAWMQYQRAYVIAENYRELLDRQHAGWAMRRQTERRADSRASQALAEARHEAATFGRERRERIRRRVRESEVIRQAEQGHEHHHSRAPD